MHSTHRLPLVVSFLLSASALIALPACDVGGEAVGCDFRDAPEGGLSNGPEPRCQERSGIGARTFGPSCESVGGAVVEGGCPRDGIVFGCDLGDSGTDPVIDWYYAPLTDADTETYCGSDEIVAAP